MALVKIKIYKWEGEFFPFKIKTICGECGLNVKIVKDVAKEFGSLVEIEEIPWLTYWYKVILKGGWHAPLVLINKKLFSQGVVVDKDKLRGEIIKEIYKDFKIEDLGPGNHIFTMPDCGFCKTTKEILNKNNIKFKEHDVIKNNINMQKMLALVLGKVHPISTPQIFFKGKWIGGTKEILKLEKIGKLKKYV